MVLLQLICRGVGVSAAPVRPVLPLMKQFCSTRSPEHCRLSNSVSKTTCLVHADVSVNHTCFHFPAPVSTCIPGDVAPCKQTAVLFGRVGFGFAVWSESAFFGCKLIAYSRNSVRSTDTLLDPTSALVSSPCSGAFRTLLLFAIVRAGLVGRVP